MALPYPAILNCSVQDVPVAWTDRDTILYALSIGAGDDPLEPAELAFVWEQGLKTIPTFATVAASARLILADLPIDITRTVAAEQSIVLHQLIPPACSSAVSDCRVAAVRDKGTGRGALVDIENVLKYASNGEKIATLVTTLFARGDGGCGTSGGDPVDLHVPPSRDPDRVVAACTRASQPLLYRLNGDRHRLHVDPDFAKALGFGRPIMHGLCTFGIICRIVLREYAQHDPSRLVAYRARFTGALYPGETIEIRLWRDGNIVSLEAYAKQRGTQVIGNGRIELV